MKIKKKHVWIGAPIVLVLLLASVILFYGMSRTFEEPEDSVAGVGLSDIMAKPEVGTPADYTPEQNAAIALGVVREIGQYRTEMSGDINANIGFMTYVQSMQDTKLINGIELYQESVSLSSMANVAQQKYVQDDNQIFLVRNAENISGQNVSWSDEITPISQETYTNTYGLLPNGISPYVVSKSTILSARRVEEADGKYVYSYELDPETAPAYYRRQVKTLSGSQKNPLFYSVKLTIEMDSDWKPVKILMNENYDISIPVLGSANCTTEYTEYFYDYGKEPEIPDKALYTAFIRDKYDPNQLGSLDASGDTDIKAYLGKVFGANENGVFALEGDVTLNGTLKKAYIEGNLKNDSYHVQLGDLYASMQGERLYFNYANLKYYVTVDGLLDALEQIGAAAGFELPDLGEDSMNEFMENMTTVQKDDMQEMTLTMDGVDLTVHLQNGTMRLLDTDLRVQFGGLQLHAYVKPGRVGHTFPKIDATYENILPLLDYVNPVLYLVNADSWEFETRAALTGQSVLELQAYVKMVRTRNGINVQLDTDILNRRLTVRLVDGMAYIDYGSLKFSLDTTDLDAISKELQAILPALAGQFSLSDLLPRAYIDLFQNPNLEGLLRNMTPIQVQGDTVSLGFRIGDDIVRFSGVKKGKFLVNAAVDGISVNRANLQVQAKLTALNAPRTTVRTKGNGYMRLEDLAAFAEPVMQVLNGKTVNLTATLAFKGDIHFNQDISVQLVKTAAGYDAILSADLFGTQVQLQFVDGVAYAQVGNVRLKLHTGDMAEIMRELQQALPSDVQLPDLSEIFPQTYVDLLTDFSPEALLNLVEEIQVDGSKLVLKLKGGARLSATRNGKELVSVGLYQMPLAGNKVTLRAQVDSVNEQQTRLTVDEAGYADLADLAKFALPVKNAVNSNSFVLDLDLQTKGKLTLAQNARLTIVRRGDSADLELTADVCGNPLSVKWVDDTAYVQFGLMKICADRYTLEEVLQKLVPGAIPAELTDWMTDFDLHSALDKVQYLRTNENTFSLGVTLGEQTAALTLKHNGEFVTDMAVSGLEFGGTQMNIQVRAMYMTGTQLSIAADKDDYTSADAILPLLRSAWNTANAKSYQFDVKFALDGKQNLTQNAKVKLSRTAQGIDGEVQTMVKGQLLHVTLKNNMTYVSYGNLQLCLAFADLQEIADTIGALLPQDNGIAVQALLPQTYTDAYQALCLDRTVNAFESGEFTTEDLQPLFDLVGQMEAFDLRTDAGEIALGFGDDTIALQFDRAYDYINEVRVGGATIADSKMELNLTNAVCSEQALPIYIPEGAYTNVKALLPFAEPTAKLVQADALEFNTTIQANGKLNGDITAQVRLQRRDGGADGEITAQLYGHTLTVRFIKGITYVDYANLKLCLNTGDLDEIVRELADALPQDSDVDLAKFLPQSYIDLLENFDIFTLVQKLENLQVAENTLSFDLELSPEDVIHFALSKDENDMLSAAISGVTVYETDLAADIAVTEIDQQFTLAVQGDYTDVRPAIAFVGPIMQTLKENGFTFNVQVKLDGAWQLNQTANVQLLLHKNADGSVQSVDTLATTEIQGKTLTATTFGKQIYLEYGDVRLTGSLDDIDPIMQRLREILPEGTLGEQADLSAMLPTVYAELIESVRDNRVDIGKLLGDIEHVTVTDNTLGLVLNMGQDAVSLQITKDGQGLSGAKVQGVHLFDHEIAVTVDNFAVSEVTIPPITDKSQYVDVNELVDYVEAGMHSYEQLNSRIFNGKADLSINGHEVKAVIVDNRLYVYYHDTTQFKVGGAPYTGIKMQMDYSALLDLAATGLDLMGIELPQDVKQHILGDRQPLDTSVLSALPIPTLEELLSDNHVNVGANVLALIQGIAKNGDTLTVTLSSKELFGDATKPDTVVTVTKAMKNDKSEIAAITFSNTNDRSTQIARPSDANNYMDFSSLNTFADSLMKTADLKQYHITGTANVNMNIIGIKLNADVPTQFRLKLRDDNTVDSAYIELKVPYYPLVIQQDMVTKIYYRDNVLYFDRCWETSKIVWEKKKVGWWWVDVPVTKYYDHHEYMKCTMDEFMQNPMKYVYFSMNFSSMVEKAIDDAIAKSPQKAVRTGNIMFEEALTGFTYQAQNRWTVGLDAAHLVNNSDFADQMVVTLGRGNNGVLNTIDLSVQVLGFINLEFKNGQLQNANKTPVDMSMVPNNLNTNSNYQFGTTTSQDIQK